MQKKEKGSSKEKKSFKKKSKKQNLAFSSIINSSTSAQEKSREKEKEKVKLQERANEIIETMRPPENYEELRAFVLYYMTTDRFNYPIDSINLYRNIAFEFNKKLDDFKGLQRMEMEPLLEELQSKHAVTLNRGSLGMKPIQYIYSTNREKVKQLNREYSKDRPHKKLHGADPGENGVAHEEVKIDPFHKMPPYPLHKPPPNHMEPPQKFSTNIHAPPPISKIDIDLNRKSALEMETQEDTEEFNKMIRSNTAVEQMIIDYFKSKNSKKIDYCEHGTREKCNFTRKTTLPCGKVHFRKMLMAHTDPSLGNCSYLDTCRHMDTCRFVHYEIEEVDIKHDREEAQNKTKEAEHLPAQWVCADIREFDFSVLGKFEVIMCDPPWDIHMSLPYGTLKDKEMRTLPVEQLQDEGLIFLWVTGRAMELGRECLELWGYRRVEEIVWIKTNQLQRIIRTGRTGHWLNHSKEHCLVGIKGDPHINRNIDCDVIVSEVRETSRKPDEIYGLIERMSPRGRKAELFARPHNRRPGWTSLGNQLPGCYIKEPEMLKRYQDRYPEAKLTEELMEEYKKEDEKTIEYTYNNHISNSTTRSGSKAFA